MSLFEALLEGSTPSAAAKFKQTDKKMELPNLRIDIDRLAQLTSVLKTESVYNPSLSASTTEISEQVKGCTKNLYLAKCWAGTLSGYMGGKSPYKNDGNRSSANDIEPTDAVADVRDTDPTIYGQKNDVEKIDYIRQEIKALIEVAIPIQADGREAAIARTNIFNYLCEARFELGFELARIKEINDAAKLVKEARDKHEKDMGKLLNM